MYSSGSPQSPQGIFSHASSGGILYEEKERYEGLTVWKIQKKNWKDIIKILGLEKTDYPYRQALNMIEGEYFWIFAYDD